MKSTFVRARSRTFLVQTVFQLIRNYLYTGCPDDNDKKLYPEICSSYRRPVCLMAKENYQSLKLCITNKHMHK